MKLITIPFSHFNTRAKWALDHHGLAYREFGYMPMFHAFGIVRHTGGRRGRADRVSTRLSTPALLLDDGQVIADSGEIVRWADAQGVRDPARMLYPEAHRDEILEFEARLHDRLGGHTRRIAYANGLLETSTMRATARRNVGPVQASLFAISSPLIGAMMRRALKISPEQGARSREAIAPEIESLSAFLSQREYCFGGRFSAADLTLACMLAPLLRPASYGAWLPPLEDFSDEVQAYVEAVRTTPVGAHALRMFAEHRAVTSGRSPGSKAGE